MGPGDPWQQQAVAKWHEVVAQVGENMCGRAIQVADDASAKEKLLACLGRQA